MRTTEEILAKIREMKEATYFNGGGLASKSDVVRATLTELEKYIKEVRI